MSTSNHVATRTFDFGGVTVGGTARSLVIAEAGVNHNGDAALAERLIDVAAEAGADVVKFQTFDPDALAGPGADMAEYQTRALGTSKSQLEMLRGLTLPLDAYEGLLAHAKKRGILFLSTPFDPKSADFLERLGLPAFKLSSGDLTNTLLLSHVAKKARPLLVSSGMGTMGEIAAALDVIRANGAPPVAVFHCVSNYPADPSDCNLRAMRSMSEAFHVPVGWSDHTMGIDVALAAIALGAQLLEKHITLDRKMPGPDHAASLEPGELRELVRSVRRVESALGDGVKAPRPSEAPIARIGRRSLHWARSLEDGAVVRAEDLTVLRPATGIEPAAMPFIVGRVVRRHVNAGAPVATTDFEASR